MPFFRPRFWWVFERLAHREDLEFDSLYREHFPGALLGQTVSCLEFLQSLGLPSGRLRPADCLAELLEPPRTWNWFKAYSWRADYELALGEIEREANEFRPSELKAAPLTTVEDVVLAWSGQPPGSINAREGRWPPVPGSLSPVRQVANDALRLLFFLAAIAWLALYFWSHR